MPFVRVSKLLPVWVTALLLSACGGLGDGSRPETLEIGRPVTALLGMTSTKVFVCFPEQMQVIATDTDGRRGDFTTRAIWTSSNPEVAQISNGEIQLEDDPTQAYGSGVLIPKSAGTTTITATFSTLSASYEVTVDAPTAITLSPTSQSLAKYSNAPLKIVAVLDGYTRDVTALAKWSIVEAETTEGTTDIATVGTSGIVTAGKTLGALTARAKFQACPAGSPSAALAENLTTAINVRELAGLTVAREFSAPLVVGTTEKFTITGTFTGTSETQDLSSQIAFTSGDSTIAGGTSPSNYVIATKAGTTTVTPRYPPTDRDDFPKIMGPDQPVVAVDRTFVSFVVTPETATVSPLGEQQYHAIATYEDGATQDITRHVTWTYPQEVLDEVQRKGITDRSGLISIGSTYLIAGLVKSLQIGDSESTIRAIRGTGDTAVEQTATFTVDAP